MNPKRVMFLFLLFCSISLLQGCYYPVVLTGEEVKSMERGDRITSYTLKNGREMTMEADNIRILDVSVIEDTLMIYTRVEYKDQESYQFSTHTIPFSDLKKVDIQRLDKNRTTYAAILTGLGVTLFTLAIILGDGDLIFLFLDMIG